MFISAGEQSVGLGRASRSRPSGFVLPGTALSVLKPLLKGAMRPLAGRLVRLGLTANQVTLLSVAGSACLGGALITDPAHPVLFALLPIWQLLRTALAAIDGTMAVDFGQKSRVGGVLNEVGDLVSDGALVAPFVAVPTFSPTVVVLMVGMIVAAEGVGVAGQLVSSGRRLEGPFGKVDRAIAFGLLGLWVSLSPPVGWVTNGVCVFFLGLLALTISNRALQVFAAAQLDAARRR